MQLEKYCIPITVTLREAMKHIDIHAKQFAVIINPDRTIVGVLTDGNIRRAIMDGASLESPIVQVMYKEFSVCDKKINATQALSIMEKNDFSHLPVVDENKKIYAVWSRKTLQGKQILPNSVVIMAGGLGSRLGSLTKDIPKPMLPVAGRPILEIVLEAFRSSGFNNFYFSVNYKAEIIEKYFEDGHKFNCNIQYIHEDKPLGTAGALSLLPVQEHDFLVSNGDILTHVNPRHLLLQHQIMQSTGTMLAKRFSMQVPYGVLDTNEYGELLNIKEKPSFDFYVSAGMNVLSPKVLAYIPTGEFFDMPELFKKLIENNEKTQTFGTDDYWLDIGHVPDYEKAQKDFL